MEGRDIALLFAAGYLGVIALVRLMTARRQSVLQSLRRQLQMAKEKQSSK